ncbi:unnamed protein product, partial [Symbiodinium microadriaticum]
VNLCSKSASLATETSRKAAANKPKRAIAVVAWEFSDGLQADTLELAMRHQVTETQGEGFDTPPNVVHATDF